MRAAVRDARRARSGRGAAEFRIRRRDGAMRWVRGEATPRREADGALRLARLPRGRHRPARARTGARTTPPSPRPPTAPRPTSCRA
ncbi:MAG: hypothetical protein MZW92_19445 [Comamonadaceae bacterium]|nr:hypothetical protein [Comamonadaceae bacterium]